MPQSSKSNKLRDRRRSVTGEIFTSILANLDADDMQSLNRTPPQIEDAFSDVEYLFNEMVFGASIAEMGEDIDAIIANLDKVTWTLAMARRATDEALRLLKVLKQSGKKSV